MKIPFLLALTCISSILPSQNIPNSGFEEWTDCVAWSTPEGFVSDNSLNYTWNQTLSVEKSTQSHSGNYAAYLHCTTSSPGVGSLQWSADSAIAFFIAGTPAAFQGTPDSLVFWAKTNATGGNESLVSAYLFNQESYSAIAEIYFSQNGLGYTRYSVPFTYTGDDPDGIFLNISSSYLSTTTTEMWIDDIELIYNNGTGDQIPNGGFENWSDYLMPCLDSWTGSNWRTLPTLSVTPGEPRTGNYSARITNETTQYYADSLGYILLGSIWANDLCSGPSLQMSLGQALTELQGYYKYTPSYRLDTAAAVIFYYAMDELSGACVELFRLRSYLPASAEWTPFTLSVPADTIQSWESDNNPQFAMIGFYSFKNQGGGYNGSVLLIDDLEWSYTTVDVEEIDMQKTSLYPVPVGDELSVSWSSETNMNIQLIDMLGKCWVFENTQGMAAKLNTSSLPDGIYILNCSAGKSSSSNRIVVQH